MSIANLSETTALVGAIRACVVPSKGKAVLTCTASKNPANVGQTVEFPAAYTVFLVNESGQDIPRVDLVSTGFATNDDEVVPLNKLEKSFTALKSGQALQIDWFEYGVLDFMIDYAVVFFGADGKLFFARFGISKASGLEKKTFSFEPLLEADAYHQSWSPWTDPGR